MHDLTKETRQNKSQDRYAALPLLGNFLIFFIALYLVWPLYGHVSAQPVVFGFSYGYLSMILGLAGVLAGCFYALLRCSWSSHRSIFFVLVIVLASLEGLFRLDSVQLRFTPAYHFRETAPYTAFSGTRDRFEPAKATPGEYRIFMLGGSTVNTGDPSLPQALQEIFHAEGHTNVRVYNYGVVSFISRQELLLLLLEVLNAAPDMIIVYDGGNNMYQPFFGDPRPGFPYNWATFESGFALTTSMASFRTTVSWILRHSALLRCTLDSAEFQEDMLHLTALRKESGYGTDAWRNALGDVWRDDWDKMLSLMAGRKIRAAFFLQPFLTQKTKLDITEAEIASRYTDVFHQHMGQGYERMRTTVGDMSSRYPGAVVADFSHALDDFPGKAFEDVIHVNAGANRALARKIFNMLTPFEPFMSEGHAH
ncbi:hypothetical protein [Fundidesulfovibrio agrisoli]|uniref:hypothetical protein n=1 Tax=Fundidesulfovibrio agrisoli TaxID=2922717 RepID=UPI001FACBDB1|nr:hypothetical protein [Fundidesulfovibrio agrisoli]